VQQNPHLTISTL
jgi:bacterioferritin-associated ferredoxin